MKTPLYRQALTHSWDFAWKHKLLWPFGLFAAFLGQMGIFELLSTVSLAGADVTAQPFWMRMLFHIADTGEAGTAAVSFGAEQWVWFLWVLSVVFALTLFFIFVSIASQGAVIHSAALSTKQKKLPSVGKSWHQGVTHFWKLFFLHVLKRAIFGGLAVFVVWASINGAYESTGGDVFLFFLVFLIAASVGVVLSFLVVYAAAYVVIEEYGFVQSIRSAWRLFTEHWLVSIEVGLIMLLLNLGLALVTMVGLVVFFLPTVLLWFVAALIGNASIFITGMVIGIALFTLFIVFIGSLFALFTTSTWTYLFMKMHKHGVKSRILHFAGVRKS